MSSTRFDRLYPGFVRELEFIIAVGRAEEADCLLRDLRQQPHFGQIDVLASTIHPAVFQELKKCARADSFDSLIRKRSREFFEGLFAVRRDLVRLYAFERKYARLHELGFGKFCRIHWQIEWSIANLLAAGVRFRFGYPVREEALNKKVEYLNSVLTARLEALAPGWM